MRMVGRIASVLVAVVLGWFSFSSSDVLPQAKSSIESVVASASSSFHSLYDSAVESATAAPIQIENAPESAYGDASNFVSATVVRVKDGDTVVVRNNETNDLMNIRLLEVDTFEVFGGKSMNDDVKEYHQNKATLTRLGRIGSGITKYYLHKGTQVSLSFKNGGRLTRGVYGRVLAFIHLGHGLVLNEILVRNGGALVYRKAKTNMHSRYMNIESAAVKERLGVWKTISASYH